ncbi:hypothetical protein [Variovorax sp. RCC_210]
MLRTHQVALTFPMFGRLANHESARTTGPYDRRQDQVSLDEVERIRI